MKPKHIWVIEDENGKPRVGLGERLSAHLTRQGADKWAVFFGEGGQVKYHAVKYVRAAK